MFLEGWAAAGKPKVGLGGCWVGACACVRVFWGWRGRAGVGGPAGYGKPKVRVPEAAGRGAKPWTGWGLEFRRGGLDVATVVFSPRQLAEEAGGASAIPCGCPPPAASTQPTRG